MTPNRQKSCHFAADHGPFAVLTQSAHPGTGASYSLLLFYSMPEAQSLVKGKLGLDF